MTARAVPARAAARAVVAAACLALLAAGCTRDFEPPERTDVVATEENRLAEVLGRPGAVLSVAATCRVRLLGQDGPVSYAWADCSAKRTSEGASVPVRVEGLDVRLPADGAGYAPSIRRMFPSRIAEAVLDHPDGYRP